MGLKKMLIGGLITTAVSTTVAKVSNDRKSEKKIETEAQIEINQEQEVTKRMALEEQNRVHRWNQSALLREARDKIPISTVCPYCDGVREIDRIAGIIKCPYCEKAEALPAAHLYDADLDGAIIETHTNDKAPVSETSKLKTDIMAKISYVLGIISIATLGIFIIPEAASIYFGIKIVTYNNEGAVSPDALKKAVTGLILSSVSIVIMIIFYSLTS